GTAQALGTITLTGGAVIEPGERGTATLRVDRRAPIAAVPGDRLLLRGFAPQRHHGTIVAGGRIVQLGRHRRPRTEPDRVPSPSGGERAAEPARPELAAEALALEERFRAWGLAPL